jgi:hypothetical protein
VARVIAQSDLWTLIHLVIVIGIILLPAGLLAVRYSIAGNGLTDALTRLGMYVAWMGGVLRRDRIDPGRDHPGPYRQTDGGVADPDHHRPDRDHAVDVGDRRPPVAPIGERGEGLTCRGRTGDPFRLVRDLPLDDLSRDQVVLDVMPIREVGCRSGRPGGHANGRQDRPAVGDTGWGSSFLAGVRQQHRAYAISSCVATRPASGCRRRRRGPKVGQERGRAASSASRD